MSSATISPAAPASDLVDALESLVQGMMRVARQEASAAGLSMPQFFLLRRIHRWGTIPATQWAEQMGTRASSTSGLVDGLVRNRWVTRTRDPNDRRKILIRMTAQGARLVGRVDAGRRRRVHEVLAELPAREIEQATVVAADLARHFAVDRDARRTSARRSGRGPQPTSPLLEKKAARRRTTGATRRG